MDNLQIVSAVCQVIEIKNTLEKLAMKAESQKSKSY